MPWVATQSLIVKSLYAILLSREEMVPMILTDIFIKIGFSINFHVETMLPIDDNIIRIYYLFRPKFSFRSGGKRIRAYFTTSTPTELQIHRNVVRNIFQKFL